MAADQGNAQAQCNLGLMYNHGQGVAQDYSAAMKWYRMAAGQGNAQAQVNLGIMYHQGQGVAQDNSAAMKWYRMAADQGYAQAQRNLGIMYEKGQGVARDYSCLLYTSPSPRDRTAHFHFLGLQPFESTSSPLNNPEPRHGHSCT